MARGIFRHPVLRDNGWGIKPVQDAVVVVCEKGTATPVADLYAAESGGSPIAGAELTTNDQGEALGYLEDPRRVTAIIKDNGTAHYPGTSILLDWTDFTEVVDVMPDPDDIATSSGDHPSLGTHDAMGLATDAELAAHVAAADPHAVYETSAEAQAKVDTHAAAADPHTGYQKESEKGAASGYASLDGSGLVPDAQIPSTIARDSEVTTAVSNHEAAADPHAGYVKESLLDAKGDLFVASAADTPARLPVGTNDHILTADSNEATGVKWAAAPSGSGIPATIVDAKGDIIVATAADTVARKAVGTNGQFLKADSAQGDGLVWAALADADIPAAIARDSEVTSAVSTHEAAADPHTGYVLESLVNAKGDLILGTADNTVARKAVGANGTLLVAASGETEGVEWRTLADGDIPSAIARDSEVTSAVSTHEAAADPHTGYLKESDVDAKGDLLVGTAADTVGRKAVGANNLYLVANSADATGLEWRDHEGAADPHPGYVLESVLDAETILYATSDNTPAALAVAASRIVGRKATGSIDDLTAAELVEIIRTSLPVEIGIAVGDETTAITTGTAKVTFRMPFAMTVTAVRANLNTASTSGIPTVDINDGGTTILSTKLTIDANEKTSQTAATAAVISDSALADDAEITIDIDVAGTGAKGLKVWIIGTRA